MAKKRAIDIELATDRQAYLPGEAVTAFVRLDPHEDLEGVECSIALVHIDRYPIGDSSNADDRAVAGEYISPRTTSPPVRPVNSPPCYPCRDGSCHRRTRRTARTSASHPPGTGR